jgi:hypothetical protein
MLSDESKRVAMEAKRLFEQKYRANLEKSNLGEFVCIEPDSQSFFLGQTFDEAVNKAIDAYPGRLTHTIRIGHDAALHLGVMVQ